MASMGVVAVEDQELFYAFRRARRIVERPERRRLLGELLQFNEPLIKTIVWQRKQHTRGAEFVLWDDAMSAGRLAFEKAAHQYNRRKGASFATYLRGKVIHELQCVARTNSPTVCVPRGQHAPTAVRYRTEDELDWLFEGSGGADDIEPAPASVELPPEPTPDTRSALEIFIDEWCRFLPAARAPMGAVLFRFECLAVSRGEYVKPGALRSALEERGVRPITVRVPWERKPVKGFRGVRLQSAI